MHFWPILIKWPEYEELWWTISQGFSQAIFYTRNLLLQKSPPTIVLFCSSLMLPKSARTSGLNNSFKAISVALNVFALSDMISAGVQCLVVSLHKQLLNTTVDKSSANSKRTALVTQHENSAMHTFSISPFLFFTYKSPAKSTPTFENGGVSLTLNSGNVAVGRELNGFPFNFVQTRYTQDPFHYLSALWHPVF